MEEYCGRGMEEQRAQQWRIRIGAAATADDDDVLRVVGVAWLLARSICPEATMATILYALRLSLSFSICLLDRRLFPPCFALVPMGFSSEGDALHPHRLIISIRESEVVGCVRPSVRSSVPPNDIFILLAPLSSSASLLHCILALSLSLSAGSLELIDFPLLVSVFRLYDSNSVNCLLLCCGGWGKLRPPPPHL